MQQINEKKRTEHLKNGAGTQEKKGNTSTGDEVCGEKKIEQICGIFQDEKLLARVSQVEALNVLLMLPRRENGGKLQLSELT